MEWIKGDSDMALTTKQVTDVCMVSSGHKACRYLVLDQDSGKYLCCKLMKLVKTEVDDKIDVYLAKLANHGQDPSMMHRG
jgi:predicted aconitase